VQATNVVGDGLQSPRTPPVTVGAPSVPTAADASPADGAAAVRWLAPSSDNGSPIAAYVVTPFLDAIAQPDHFFTPTATAHTISGLVNGGSYTFAVAALNANGTSLRSDATVPIVVGAPLAASVTATGSAGQAIVSWTAPDNNGSVVTSYVVTTYLGAVQQSTKTHTLTCTPQPCRPARTWAVTGLTNGRLYTFTVVAVNARGAGLAGSTTIRVGASTVPGVSIGVHAMAGVTGATLSWAAPANGSATITAYVITPYKAGVAQPATVFDAKKTTRTLTGLTSGQSYTFTVAARSAAGTGPESTPSNAVTPV